jgi:hypothetical protein
MGWISPITEVSRLLARKMKQDKALQNGVKRVKRSMNI